MNPAVVGVGFVIVVVLVVGGYVMFARRYSSTAAPKTSASQTVKKSAAEDGNTSEQAKTATEYAIKDIGVHFSYPANWSASTGAEGRSVELGLPDSQARYVHITYSVTSAYSLQEIMSSIEKNRQTENSDYRRIGSAETIIDNHPALRYECEYNKIETGKAPVLYKETDHIMIKDDTMIILSLAAPAGDYEALLPGFNDLVSGFKLS